jgi:2-methylcitrate dehydratase PrpD
LRHNVPPWGSALNKPAHITQSLTETLARRIQAPVDDAVGDRAARHLVDWIACAGLGAVSKQGAVLARHGANQPPGPCTALGAGGLSATAASFVNGGLGNIYELDDLHRTSILHAGDVVVPAALAVAQRENAPGKRLLESLVKGYEIAIRIAIAASSDGYTPWYNSSTCGVFGAAAAAATILQLNGDRLVDALGQAGMQASGLWQCRLEATYSKQLASARAAEAGVTAADLAKLGFPGARRILEGELGFFSAFYPQARPDAVIADIDGDWKMRETSFKPWPACRHAHPVIEAVFGLKAKITPGKIRNIDIETYQAAIEFCDRPKPTTEHDAQFFGDEARQDPAISALRNKIRVVAKDRFSAAFPLRYGARVTAHLADGTSHETTVQAAKGDPENPMTEGELKRKYRQCLAQAGVSETHAQTLFDQADYIAQSPDMTGLTKALEAASGDIAIKRKTG